MKKIAIVILILISLFMLYSCNNVKLNEFYAYKDGKVYYDFNDIKTEKDNYYSTVYMTDGLCTKRGLKVGDTLDDVRRLYPDFEFTNSDEIKYTERFINGKYITRDEVKNKDFNYQEFSIIIKSKNGIINFIMIECRNVIV